MGTMHDDTTRGARFAGTRRHTFLWGSLLALVVLCAGGCKAKVAGAVADDEPGLTITSLDVKGASTLDDASHDALKDAVREAITGRLSEGPLVVDGDARRHPAKGVVRFELLTDPEGVANSLILHLNIDVVGKDDHGPIKLVGESWAALESAEGEDQQGLQARAAARAAEEAVRQLVLQAGVNVASDTELSELLVDDNSDTILSAMREVGRRNLTEFAPAVANLLVHPSRDIVIIALATLGQLGDPNTAAQVKDLVASPDPEKVERALYALADIGGEEAMDALRKVAANHPERVVRALATDLLRAAALRNVR